MEVEGERDRELLGGGESGRNRSRCGEGGRKEKVRVEEDCGV